MSLFRSCELLQNDELTPSVPSGVSVSLQQGLLGAFAAVLHDMQ